MAALFVGLPGARELGATGLSVLLPDGLALSVDVLYPVGTVLLAVSLLAPIASDRYAVR